MFSRFGRALRALLAVTALCAAIVPVAAHEGHDHDEQPPAVSATALPRGETDSNAFEIVAVVRGDHLEIHVDRFATNEPVIGAVLEVETPAGSAKATANPDGTYHLPAPWLAKNGRTDLIFTVTADGATDILPMTLQTARETAQSAPQEDATHDGRIGTNSILLVLAGLVAGALLTAIAMHGRRAAAIVVILAALAGIRETKANEGPHEGHGHEQDKAQVAIDVVAGERAQRLPDGAVFVPKTVQRIFALRTLVAEQAKHRKVSELPGRIIPDPNASGYAQSAVGGRLSAPPDGFPRLGTRVKQGDILGYVTPPIQAIDVSDMRQRQGELDQQISIVERRFARYEQLAPSGAISRTQLEDTRLELEGLRDRRASIERASRREPEALIAPVAGIIAEGSAVAGQIVQPSSIVFNIIDPARLWVEALSFESVEPSQGARATTYTGKNYDLTYRGTGFADRSQSVPVHFAITGDTAGLRAGQFLTVLVATDETKEGLAVPRSSVVRGSNGQDFVYEHVAPERFVPRSVRTEPLDGDRVLIVSGIASGKRVVSQGADLLDHVR
ncbi:HlyD family efflux transporter periplasmic adaptor subunit [Bradyrhizobium sp. CB3481]|uniref:efflux RND transporter periplasmic adaptor subunit n=1 Tax=Bradyrhizobium sp. CB3481 TaxID=3039158 RepID=UPI0024B0A2A3|nr:HlyD family efflux transporter periplasmic adaptor subunit [Bradyrhizobium sp. CB3481]WFU19214.1 HlyD family efflux transporter periplasmic adaptor subunit [Bradyrhizobium sp. CB3481]